MSAFPALPPRSAPVLDVGSPLLGEPEGKSFSLHWFGLFKAMQALFSQGFTGTITTAKLTGGGTNGSITFENGVVVSQTPAT